MSLIKDLFALKLTTFLQFRDQMLIYRNSTVCICVYQTLRLPLILIEMFMLREAESCETTLNLLCSSHVWKWESVP